MGIKRINRLFLSSIIVIPFIQLACVSQPLIRPKDQLFLPLAERKISDFEQQLAHIQLSGGEGDALTLGIQWLHAILCIPYPVKAQYDSSLWEALSIGLSLETTDSNSPILFPLRTQNDEEFKARKLSQADWAFWPLKFGDEEGWSDEYPAWLNVYSKCPKDLSTSIKQVQIEVWPISLLFDKQALSPVNLMDIYRYLKLNRASNLLDGWLQNSERADHSFETKQTEKSQIPSQLPSEVHVDSQIYQEWRWWLEQEQAVILGRYSGVSFGWPAQLTKMTWAESHVYAESCFIWKKLYRESLGLSLNSTQERRLYLLTASSKVALLAGLCHVSLGEDAAALEAWDYAVFSAQDDRAPTTLALARYHQLRLLIELGRYTEAVKLRDVMPSPQSALYTPYVFALGEAMSYAGYDDSLMALCTEVFRDRSWRRDPFLRALFYLFVRTLTRFEFESRVLELLEDLGPRNELYERVYIFAHVALDDGMDRSGKAATRWLLGHHESMQWRPRYHALEARIAILRLDKVSFRRALRTISPAKGTVVEAIHKGRRGAFFAKQDQALVELLRVEIPKVAGWPSQTNIDRKIRVEWLDLIAQEMQMFLRLRPETRVHGELIALYRSIKQNLPVHRLRAYSEKVGRSQRSSVLIGYVRVNAVDLSHLEPRQVSFYLNRPPALTLLPQGTLDPSQWRLTWPIDVKRTIKKRSFRKPMQ